MDAANNSYALAAAAVDQSNMGAAHAHKMLCMQLAGTLKTEGKSQGHTIQTYSVTMQYMFTLSHVSDNATSQSNLYLSF